MDIIENSCLLAKRPLVKLTKLYIAKHYNPDLFKPLPILVICYDVVSTTSNGRTQLDGVRCFEMVLGPQCNGMVRNVQIERKETDIFRICKVIAIRACQWHFSMAGGMGGQFDIGDNRSNGLGIRFI